MVGGVVKAAAEREGEEAEGSDKNDEDKGRTPKIGAAGIVERILGEHEDVEGQREHGLIDHPAGNGGTGEDHGGEEDGRGLAGGAGEAEEQAAEQGRRRRNAARGRATRRR